MFEIEFRKNSIEAFKFHKTLNFSKKISFLLQVRANFKF